IPTTTPPTTGANTPITIGRPRRHDRRIPPAPAPVAITNVSHSSVLDVPLTRPGVGLRQASLRANFSWSFCGNVVYAACQWGMLIVLAKLASPESVGRFALGLAVTAPVVMLSNLQLRGVLATDARQEHPYTDYLTLRLFTTSGALAVVG